MLPIIPENINIVSLVESVFIGYLSSRNWTTFEKIIFFSLTLCHQSNTNWQQGHIPFPSQPNNGITCTQFLHLQRSIPLSPLVARFQLTTLGSTALRRSRKNNPLERLLSWIGSTKTPVSHNLFSKTKNRILCRFTDLKTLHMRSSARALYLFVCPV